MAILIIPSGEVYSPSFKYPDYPGYSFGVILNGYVSEYDACNVEDSYGPHLRSSTASTSTMRFMWVRMVLSAAAIGASRIPTGGALRTLTLATSWMHGLYTRMVAPS